MSYAGAPMTAISAAPARVLIVGDIAPRLEMDFLAYGIDNIVARDAADAVVRVFRSLLAVRFPIASVRTVEAFGSDDARSMAANNTSAYNCRRTTGGTGWSGFVSRPRTTGTTLPSA